jgi:phage-related protein
MDTRDMLGGVVEIKTTFANFLDTWPEYSSVESVRSNVVEVYNALPYRVGDNVKAKIGTIEATIQAIEENSYLFLSNELDSNVAIGDPLYIVNQEADSESYVEDKFKIDQLEALNDSVAKFSLISWLQYFKLVTPKRKYYKNTCQWVYKGPECQYPGPAGGQIPGAATGVVANTNPIAANNEIAADSSGDICSKSLQACTLRNNQLHFGGFPGTGRTLPRQ